MTLKSNDFNELLGEDLSGVTFVRDYIQLQFNPPPILNAYTPVTVSAGGRSATLGDEAFANMIIGQINKYVKSVDVQPDVVIAIHFEDTSIVSISLRPSDYRGAEAINLFKRNKGLLVE